jgi:hypothetical protein
MTDNENASTLAGAVGLMGLGMTTAFNGLQTQNWMMAGAGALCCIASVGIIWYRQKVTKKKPTPKVGYKNPPPE